MVIDHHTICPIATYSMKHLNKVKSYFKHNGCVAGKKVRIVQDISILVTMLQVFAYCAQGTHHLSI